MMILVRTHLFKDGAVGFVARLAEDLRHAQLLQIDRGESGGGKVAADAHNGTVKILYADGAQKLLVPGVAYHRPKGDVRKGLHLLLPDVQNHDVRAHGAEPFGDLPPEATEADYDV